MPESADLTGSVLTPTQRRYLEGTSDIEPGSARERMTQNRIEKRIRVAMYDFALLFDYMDEAMIREIFSESEPLDGEAELRVALQKAFGFLYHSTQTFHPPFDGLLEIGISQAEREFNNRRVSVEPPEVESRSPVEMKHVVEKVAAGNMGELTEEDLRWFVDNYSQSDEFDPEIALEEFYETSTGQAMQEYQEKIDELDSDSDVE